MRQRAGKLILDGVPEVDGVDQPVPPTTRALRDDVGGPRMSIIDQAAP
jgi:hypothetical protein